MEWQWFLTSAWFILLVPLVMPRKVPNYDGVYESTTMCTHDMTECEFWLVAEEKLTMIQGKRGYLKAQGNTLSKLNTNGLYSRPLDDNATYVQGDGYITPRRLVYVYNGTMPGPPIEVYEGQTVIVHFTNSMKSESTSIHWHGIHQRGTSFMDGVAFVSQCPVLPGQEFTYKFIANPSGTHWYHAHIGSQRTNGLFGAFIVHLKGQLKLGSEHLLILNDWNHDWESNEGQLHMLNGIIEGATVRNSYPSISSGAFSAFKYQSGLINGKGRYYTSPTSHNQAPLHVFNVTRGIFCRFRCINAGNVHPFRIWVDRHNLEVHASDGYEIDPEGVQSLVINPGERYDFVISTDKFPEGVPKVYFIIAETLTDVATSQPPQRAEAYLAYDGSTDPTITPIPTEPCSEERPCTVLNCPFTYFPGKSTILKCKDFGSIQGRHRLPDEYRYAEDIFLNFAFPMDPLTNNTPGSINGRMFEHEPYPTFSSLENRRNDERSCYDGSCGDNKTDDTMDAMVNFAGGLLNGAKNAFTGDSKALKDAKRKHKEDRWKEEQEEKKKMVLHRETQENRMQEYMEDRLEDTRLNAQALLKEKDRCTKVIVQTQAELYSTKTHLKAEIHERDISLATLGVRKEQTDRNLDAANAQIEQKDYAVGMCAIAMVVLAFLLFLLLHKLMNSYQTYAGLQTESLLQVSEAHTEAEKLKILLVAEQDKNAHLEQELSRIWGFLVSIGFVGFAFLLRWLFSDRSVESGNRHKGTGRTGHRVADAVAGYECR